MPRIRPKPGYAERAKRHFLRGTTFKSPHAAIESKARTDEEWAAFLEGQKYRLAFESGLKGRKRVKSRHPMNGGNMAQSGPKSSEMRKRRHSPADIVELEQRATQINHVTGLPAERIEKQARIVFDLFLEFQQIGILGTDFTRWLRQHSGLARFTCQRRLKLGRRLAAQGKLTTSAKQAEAEQRRLEITPVAEMDWSKD